MQQKNKVTCGYSAFPGQKASLAPQDAWKEKARFRSHQIRQLRSSASLSVFFWGDAFQEKETLARLLLVPQALNFLNLNGLPVRPDSLVRSNRLCLSVHPFSTFKTVQLGLVDIFHCSLTPEFERPHSRLYHCFDASTASKASTSLNLPQRSLQHSISRVFPPIVQHRLAISSM